MSVSVVRVVCRPMAGTGFGLAGLTAETVPAGSDPAPRLEAVAAHPDTGVVLVEEPIYDGLTADLRQRLERSVRPVVVPFPAPMMGAGRAAEERVAELLRRAIGYRVRLR